MDSRVGMRSRLQQYRKERRKFATKVYIITFIFSLVCISQWLLMLLLTDVKIQPFLVEHFYVSSVFLFVALLVATIFIFFEELRFKFIINWVLAIVIVECVTLGLAMSVAGTKMLNFYITLSVVAFVVILLIVIGIYMPHDFTLDVVVLFVCSVVFFIGSVFFVMLHILMGVPYSLYVFAAFVIGIVALFIMYHAQTINGGRYAEMRLNDFLLAALILFHDSVILFVLIFFLASGISNGFSGRAGLLGGGGYFNGTKIDTV